jgi:hypothetical protein
MTEEFSEEVKELFAEYCKALRFAVAANNYHNDISDPFMYNYLNIPVQYANGVFVGAVRALQNHPEFRAYEKANLHLSRDAWHSEDWYYEREDQ